MACCHKIILREDAAGLKTRSFGVVLSVMNTDSRVLNMLSAHAASAVEGSVAAVQSVTYWWFGYGYFSQEPGRP